MKLRGYHDLPEEHLYRYLATYHELCSTTPRVWPTFFLGILGHGAAAALPGWGAPAIPGLWLGIVIVCSPFWIYMMLVFCNAPPPITPGEFRRLLAIVSAWYLLDTVIALIATLVAITARPPGPAPVAFSWAMILIGFTAIATLMRFHRTLLVQEREVADVEGAAHGA